MNWVVICTLACLILANSPLVYILFRVHYPSGLSPLWGYGPNQFLFPLLAFPMAAFATFLGMRLLVSTLQQSPPQHLVIRWTAENWIVVSLIGIILTSSICIVDYFFSAKTFDKLQPIYAQRAISAAKEVRQTILAFPKENREDKRQEAIDAWRTKKEEAVAQLATSTNIQQDVLGLSSGVYLQIIQDPSLQRSLHLMNPVVHALNVVQVFTSVFTAFCALFVTILCVYVFKTEVAVSQTPDMSKALSAVFFAVTFFSFFPILYAQQRSEIEYLVGSGYTVMPQVFSGIIVIGLLMALATLAPVKGNISEFVTGRVIPLLFVGVGFGFNIFDSHPLRQLVGIEANWGTRTLLIMFFLIAWVVIVLHLWPWKSPNSAARINNQSTTGSSVP